jgi:hypothetical protein
MAKRKNIGNKCADDKSTAKNDLRHGMHGSLTASNPPLVGGVPMDALEDPPLATPDFGTPPGQTTHE